jgi:hypothetical protein
MKVRFIKDRVIPYCNKIGDIIDVSEPVASLLLARGKVEVVKEKEPKSKKVKQ